MESFGPTGGRSADHVEPGWRSATVFVSNVCTYRWLDLALIMISTEYFRSIIYDRSRIVSIDAAHSSPFAVITSISSRLSSSFRSRHFYPCTDFWGFFAAFMARSSPDGYEKVGMESFTLATVSVRAVHARARPALTRGQKRWLRSTKTVPYPSLTRSLFFYALWAQLPFSSPCQQEVCLFVC